MKRQPFNKYSLLFFHLTVLLSCSAPTALKTEPSARADEQAIEAPPSPSPTAPIIFPTPIPTPSTSAEPVAAKDEPSPYISETPSNPVLPTPSASPEPKTTATPTSEVSVAADENTVQNSDQKLAEAFENQTNNLQIEGTGIVTRLLTDDTAGSRHQRFIVKLASGQTLLIAHNIDLAPKILDLKVGDRITFYGEYEWNNQGGVIHWTHKDPAQVHETGWLKHKNTIYQ